MFEFVKNFFRKNKEPHQEIPPAGDFSEKSSPISEELQKLLLEVESFNKDFYKQLIQEMDSFIDREVEYITYLPALGLLLEEYCSARRKMQIDGENTKSLTETKVIFDKITTKEVLDCIGPFYFTIFYNIGGESNNILYTLKDIDMEKYSEYFNSPLSREVFNFFSNLQDGLSQSIQGTLAASEIIATRFMDSLYRELNLAYPGSGSHLTPLIMAFDMIDRNVLYQ